MEFMTLGCGGNARLTLDVSRDPGCSLDYLHITVSSSVDADFINKITLKGITHDDIDSICRAFRGVQHDLRK